MLGSDTKAAFRKSRAKTLEGLKAPQYLTHLYNICKSSFSKQ